MVEPGGFEPVFLPLNSAQTRWIRGLVRFLLLVSALFGAVFATLSRQF